MQRCGVEEILESLDNEEKLTLILVKRGARSTKLQQLISIAEERGIKVIQGSENDIWRMSRDNGGGTPDALGLVGREPNATLEQTLSKGGLVWLLAGAAYPVNIGFCIRTAEVSGADAVIIDADLTNQERKSAKRASMKAHRFIPVHWTDGLEAVREAKKAGFRIISLEDIGDTTPWESDLTGDIVIIVGGERHGIPADILEESDQVIRIPMTGFVPSFNLQAPLSSVAIEAQRQRN